MIFRKYNPENDRAALLKIVKEVGWSKDSMEIYVTKGREIITELNGQVEAFCSSSLGNIQYLEEQIPFCEIGTMATSFLARRKKIAGKMTALKIAEDVAEGAAVCGLGMFDQGFYDKLGFGSGSYTHWITFPLKALKITGRPRTPIRLTVDDFELINESLHNRKRAHGSFACTSDLIYGTMADGGLGYGYLDQKGKLTHHIWLSDANLLGGPLNIYWWSYQNEEQLFELLQLVKSLEDQIVSVKTMELPGLNLQDLLERPFHYSTLTENSKHQYKVSASAFWQMRILDLKKCISLTKLPFGSLEFNLKLADPIEKYLSNENVSWRGISGDYIVTLGKESVAHGGSNPKLPTLEASVGAFTRIWLGCDKVSRLKMTDDLKASEKLITDLDNILSLPLPYPDHPF